MPVVIENVPNGKFDIHEFMETEQSKDLLRLTTAGSVDDGKSTLIGRLLHDAKGVYEDQVKSVSKGGKIDFALLTDGLRAEREQGITIDVAYRYFATPKRKFILADTPGHEQYTRNMATGASTAELAIILCDAARGLTTQSRRHAYIAGLLGIPHFIIAVNKMDLVGYSEDVFNQIRAEFEPFLKQVKTTPGDLHFIPLSALKGDNVLTVSPKMEWYGGRSLMEYLTLAEVRNRTISAPFRMAVQGVLRPDQNFRGYTGQIASGVIHPGDEILALPSGRRSRVRRVATFDGDLKVAHAPLSVTLTLEDEIDIGRGDMLSSGPDPESGRTFDATMVWFDGRPLDTARHYLVKHNSHVVPAHVEAVKSRLNVVSLETESGPSIGLSMNEVGIVRIATSRSLFFDPYTENRYTGSFILIDRETNATAAAGMILSRAEDARENAGDRLARLIRGFVPSDALLNLPSDDASAIQELRRRLEGVWDE
jgi:sulfate adenylyltransferase large subunit